MKLAPLLLLLALALGACAGVLGLERSNPSHPFEHRAHSANGINCLTCHAGVAGDGDDQALHLPSAADCLHCHARPHDSRPCLDCHGASYVRGAAELARQHLRFDHRQHMPAVNGDCVRCHTAAGDAKPESLEPKMAICFGCHEHRDQWTVRDCEGCHVELPAENTVPSTHVMHDGDWLREHGVRAASEADLCASCHSERSCAACHGVGTVPALPAKLAFDDTPLAGLHRAGFRARHAGEARADPGTCTTCHRQESCIDCHLASGVAPGSATRSPHPPGWLSGRGGGGDHGREARTDPASCAACHGGSGEQLCVGCHRVGGPGGNPHGPGFSSTKDQRRDRPCLLCHGGGAR